MDGTAPLKTPEKKPRQKRWLRIGLIIAGLCGLVAFAWAMTQLPHYLELQQMMRDPMVQKNLLGMTLEEGYERMRVPRELSLIGKPTTPQVVRRYAFPREKDQETVMRLLRNEIIGSGWSIDERYSDDNTITAVKYTGEKSAMLSVYINLAADPKDISIIIELP